MSEWKEYKLGEIGFFNNGVNKDKHSFGHGYPFVNLMDIFEKDTISKIPKGLVDVSQDELNRYNLKDGDILFARSSVKLEGVGKVCSIIKDLENTIYSGFIIRFRQSELIIDKLFASYYLNSAPIRVKIIAKATLSANSNINQESLKTISIKIPLLPEQHKIAKILSSADSVIAKTQVAIAKYKAIKQGMLNDLFTRGIDIKTGKLRPNYADAPELYKESALGWIPLEWEALTVDDVSENLDGKRIPVKQGDRDKQAEIYPYYGASGIIDLVENFIFDEPLILLGEDGENVISRNLPLAFKVKGKIWVNNHAHVLKPIKNVTTIDFLCEALEAVDYTPIVSGSAQPKITQGHLNKILLPIPTIEEQEIISLRIMSLNQKIQTEQQYLQKLQQLKTGLMADLLSGKKKVEEE